MLFRRQTLWRLSSLIPWQSGFAALEAPAQGGVCSQINLNPVAFWDAVRSLATAVSCIHSRVDKTSVSICHGEPAAAPAKPLEGSESIGSSYLMALHSESRSVGARLDWSVTSESSADGAGACWNQRRSRLYMSLFICGLANSSQSLSPHAAHEEEISKSVQTCFSCSACCPQVKAETLEGRACAVAAHEQTGPEIRLAPTMLVFKSGLKTPIFSLEFLDQP